MNNLYSPENARFVFIAIICSAGIFLGFANPVFHFPPVIFAFLAGMNLIAMHSGSAFQVFRRAVIASGIGYTAALYWIVVPVNVHGGVPLALAVFCPLLLGFFLGLFSSLYALFVFRVKDHLNWIWLGISAGCAWAALEFIREYSFTGFPWLILAQSLAVWPETVQSISFIGSYGLAAVVTACVLWFCMQRIRTVLTGVFVLLAVLGAGYIMSNLPSDFQRKNFLAVQGNIDQTLKWEQDIQELTIRKYMDLSLEGIEKNRPELVIWPETALPFYFQEPTELAFLVRNFAAENQIQLLAGSPAYEMDDDGVGYTLFNRAFLVSEDGLIIDFYDKERLVPFGEYIPLSGLIPFVGRLVHGELDFSRGSNVSPLISGDLALGVLICYEIIFPGLVRKRVAYGANLLINISNDAWFGNTSAPLQHLHLAVLRAVEQNRYVLRATNTGISAFIDPKGNIYNRTSMHEDAFISDTAGIVDGVTVYHRLHWLINLLTVAVAFSVLVFSLIRKRQLAL